MHDSQVIFSLVAFFVVCKFCITFFKVAHVFLNRFIFWFKSMSHESFLSGI